MLQITLAVKGGENFTATGRINIEAKFILIISALIRLGIFH